MKNEIIYDPEFDSSRKSSITSLSTCPTIPERSSLEITNSIPIHLGVSGDCIEYIEHLDAFVIGDQGGYLTMWKYPQWKKIAQIKCHRFYVCSVKYNPQQNEVISASYDRTIQVHKVLKDGSLKTIKVIRHQNQIDTLLVLPESKVLIAGGSYMNLTVYNLDNFSVNGKIETKEVGGIGQHFIYLQKFGLIACGFASGRISLLDPKENFKEVCSVECEPVEEEWYITLGFDERYDMLYGCVHFHSMRSWIVTPERTLEPVGEYKFPGNNILSFLPCELDGREVILMSSIFSKVHVFDVISEEFSSLFNDNYARFRYVEEKNFLLLTSNQVASIDVAKYQPQQNSKTSLGSHNCFEDLLEN